MLGCFKTMLEQPRLVETPGNVVADLKPQSTTVDHCSYVSFDLRDRSVLCLPPNRIAVVVKPSASVFYPFFFTYVFVNSVKDMRVIPSVTLVQESLSQPRAWVLTLELMSVMERMARSKSLEGLFASW